MISLLPLLVGIVSGLIVFIYLLLWKWPWLKDDYYALKPFIKAHIRSKSNLRKKKFYIDEFEDKVQRLGSKTALFFEDESYTFEDLNHQINKVAHASLKIGLKPGDTVALLISNEPAFIWTYLGLAKIGVHSALLNFNLRSKSLLHCITVSEAKTLIVGKDKELIAAVEDIYEGLNNNITVLAWGDQANLPPNFKSLKEPFEDAPTDDPDKSLRNHIKETDTLCYIYTSGTTGLPKPAIITQARAVKGSCLLAIAGGLNSDDIVYTPLPLYHTVGNIMGLGATILLGTTLVLRRKFSASNFFSDCVRYKVTIIQYIGELCRYLLAAPPSQYDKAHCIRLAFGNGLRKDIWKEFQERFAIPDIGEFYGATEGNIGLLNNRNRPGAVGTASPLLMILTKIAFVKYNYETAEPERNEAGLCIPAERDEPGLLLSPINKVLSFDGYKGGKEQSRKKILSDVVKKGDNYFNTGDLFIRDKDYFVYFADRIGDTFRWKGENVSTVEVSNTVSELDWIEDANVYGVSVPGNDGRAGMVAIIPVENHKVTPENLADLFHHCSRTLPIYAIPRFVRVQLQMQLTSTFKQPKMELVKEAFDPSKVKNSDLFYANFSNKTYELITTDIFNAISEGRVRL